MGWQACKLFKKRLHALTSFAVWRLALMVYTRLASAVRVAPSHVDEPARMSITSIRTEQTYIQVLPSSFQHQTKFDTVTMSQAQVP